MENKIYLKLLFFSIIFIISLLISTVNSAYSQKDYTKRRDHPEIPRINAYVTRALFNKRKLILANAHDLKTHYRKHIVGSISIPNNKVKKMKIKLPKNKIIAFYCEWAGDFASASSAAHFWKKGYRNVRIVEGGTEMLLKAGFQMWYRK